MRFSNRQLLIIIISVQIIFSSPLWSQNVRILTYDEAISIALKESYTVKSYLEKKLAMQQYFNYYQAQFKPRLDFNRPSAK